MKQFVNTKPSRRKRLCTEEHIFSMKNDTVRLVLFVSIMNLEMIQCKNYISVL